MQPSIIKSVEKDESFFDPDDEPITIYRVKFNAVNPETGILTGAACLVQVDPHLEIEPAVLQQLLERQAVDAKERLERGEPKNAG